MKKMKSMKINSQMKIIMSNKNKKKRKKKVNMTEIRET